MDLLAAVVFVPLAASIVVTLVPARHTGVTTAIGLLTSLVVVGLVAGVAATVQRDGIMRFALADWRAPLGIELRADQLSVLLLGLTALVGAAVSVYATGSSSARGGRMFWPLWLALWSGLNAVYIAGDLFNTYVALELMGVAAVSLVALGGAQALRPALRYLYVAVLGSLLYLLGVALVYGQTGTLDLELAADGIRPDVVGGAVLVLMTVGLALKTALFPMHSWLPDAHSSAPAAVSALLSALVVKATLYVLIRVWFTVLDTEPAFPLDLAVGLLGATAVGWGTAMALREVRLKRIVGYSTVAQVGYLFLVFPLVTPGLEAEPGSALGEAALAGWTGGLALLLGHGVAKAAMFLAAGNIGLAYGSDDISGITGAAARMPLSVAAFGLAGVSLAGLPPTFGFIGKWQLLQASLGTGQWWWVIVLLVGGLLTFGYSARVLRATFNPTRAFELPEPEHLPRRMEVVALSLAVLAVVLGIGSLPILTFAGDGVLIGAGP
ncbi:complex I subunit 5 family protein [Phytoactinopolyspora mesophila]|uniref:Sodium:proton antiporter n=1 Tax=Phytoactinopolyspora mesophila TaxID=2650750 RepID=A0A7K3M3W8_9ACTN|nr:proton-conducting transporter membrane subunit [Phytoactinopolyspora mesophila]NDL57936.1 sodium:proton antiporter [Phytoactinopolyspora mesophila]